MDGAAEPVTAAARRVPGAASVVAAADDDDRSPAIIAPMAAAVPADVAPMTPKAAQHDERAFFSVGAHFDERCCVLLTGASGYIGSLVLEKLLRTTRVGHVFLLLRPRRGVAPAERVAKLLRGPLFHLLTEADVAGRVSAVAGDINEPGLGLSDEDAAMLADRVDTVVHSAADIRLDAPIHDTLTANYRGSCAMAQLGARMRRLRAMVHVSTCYVNINKPPGSRVEERLYPLPRGADGREPDAAAVAEELLALPRAEADARAAEYIERWGFKNTYAMGKHLAEKAVTGLAAKHGLPLVILRPSLVAGLAELPYPGYIGNFAGPAGAAVSYMLGMYDDQPEAAAVTGQSVWDLIPGDIVASAIVVAAAGAASPAGRAAMSVGEPLPPQQLGAGEGAGATTAPPPPLMVVQAATSCTYPITASLMYNQAFMWCSAHHRTFTLARGRSRPMDPAQALDEAAWARHMAATARRVERVAWALDHLGAAARRAAKTARVALRCYRTINSPGYDARLLFSADRLQALEAALAPGERALHACVWRPPPAAAAPEAPLLGVATAVNGPRRGAGAPSLLRALVGGCFNGGAVAADCGSTGSGGSGSEHDHDHKNGAAADGDDAKRIAAAAAVPAAMRAAGAAANGGGWVAFCNNGLAFLYKTFYGRSVAAEKRVPAKAWAAAEPFLTAEQRARGPVVRHAFVHVKRRR